MIRSLAALIGSTCVMATPALADDPLACLDPAVADTLLAKPNEGPHAVVRGLPDDFPDIVVPAEFELIGGRTLLQRSIAAFKTSLSNSQALGRLEAVSSANGWRRFAESNQLEQGFQLPSRSQARSIHLCKPAKRRVSAQAFPAPDGSTYLTLTAAVEHFGEGCEAMDMGPRAHHQVPVLYLPEPASGSTYGTTPESEWATTSFAQIESPRTAAQIMDHFAAQLAAQAWRRVAVWTQDSLVGSAWTSEDQPAYGLLTVIEDGSGVYRLQFDVLGDDRSR